MSCLYFYINIYIYKDFCEWIANLSIPTTDDPVNTPSPPTVASLFCTQAEVTHGSKQLDTAAHATSRPRLLQ